MAAKNALKVQVMMVGGRRCGKTSILAAMKSNFEKKFKDTDLILTYDNMDTLNILEEKKKEISNYFSGGKKRVFIPDSTPTSEMMTYSLSVGIKDKKDNIQVDFLDYPGEWLMDKKDKEHRSFLLEAMKKSQVLMIAIDTPHMMEYGGIFNEDCNFCQETGELIKMALEKTHPQRMLVLFVPLKCERYLNDNRMSEVIEAVKCSYEELIGYFKTVKRYEVAITPIFTFGKAQFSHFERDKETGIIKINSQSKTPEKAIYCFPSMDVKEPEPKYCEQPLVYLLTYLMDSSGKDKKNLLKRGMVWEKMWEMLMEKFFDSSSFEDYQKQKNSLLRKLKKSGEGYDIIIDPMNWNLAD